MATFLSRFPYCITGDSYRTLQSYDANSRKKISVLGWFVLIPTVLWFITAYLIVTSILQQDVKTGVLTGIIAAFFVFIFERSVVQSKKVHWAMALMRILLGCCIAIFSSGILDLILFKNDIQHFAEEQLVRQQKAIVSEADSMAKKAGEVFLREMDGRSATGHVGYGPIAKQKQAIYNSALHQAVLAHQKLDTLKAILAQPGTTAYKTLIVSLGMDTILNRIKLLHEFVMTNTLALIAWLILLAIGILLELFCILTKLFIKKTAYELDEEAHEAILANKREQVLQQSNYYLQLGVQGRAVEQHLRQKHPTLLN